MSETTGKFSSIPQAPVPEEAKEHFESMSKKTESFHVAKDQLLSASSKEELKSKLPIAIVLKKNLKQDVAQIYSRFKEFKENNPDPDEVHEFKEACNTIIRDAQKAHQEIKEKVYAVYDKKPS